MPIVYEDIGTIKSKDLYAFDPTAISTRENRGKIYSISIGSLSLKKANGEIIVRNGMLRVTSRNLSNGLTITNFEDPLMMINEALNVPCDFSYYTLDKLMTGNMAFWSDKISTSPFDKEIEKFKRLKDILHTCVEDETIIAVPEGYVGWFKKA